jgi:hypothetical protein
MTAPTLPSNAPLQAAGRVGRLTTVSLDRLEARTHGP